RQKAFDDFAAVAKDMEDRGFTSADHVGIVGASNGGVLTTVTMTQHPELLNAVVVQRPLIDMLRYTRFGAGQSWTEEQKHHVLFYESAEGGHGAGVTHAQEAEYWALSYTFFRQKLRLGGPASAGPTHANFAPR